MGTVNLAKNKKGGKGGGDTERTECLVVFKI